MIELILFAHVMAVLNTTHHKHTIEKYGIETQLFWKFSISFLMLIIVFHKDFYFENSQAAFISIVMVSITSLIVTIFANQLLKDVSIQKFVAIMMLNIPITYVIDIILKNRVFSYSAVLGIALIMYANYRVSILKKTDKKNSIFLPIVIILFVGIARSVFINVGLSNDHFSQSFVNLVFFFTIFIFALIFYQKKINFSPKILTDYSIQSFFNVGLNYAVISIISQSVFLPTIIAATSNMITVLLSRISLNNNVRLIENLGIIAGTLGVILIVLS